MAVEGTYNTPKSPWPYLDLRKGPMEKTKIKEKKKQKTKWKWKVRSGNLLHGLKRDKQTGLVLTSRSLATLN